MGKATWSWRTWRWSALPSAWWWSTWPPTIGQSRACVEAHTLGGGEHLAAQPLPPSTFSTHSSLIFLPSYMYVSVKEKGESRCFAITNLTENHPAEGGESVDSGLRQMVRFSILVGGAGWGSSSPPCGTADGCSYVRHYGYLHDPTLVRLQNCHLASWDQPPLCFVGLHPWFGE